MRQIAWMIGLALCSTSLSGCVERRFVVNSDPPGARVYHNGQAIGDCPVDRHFLWHGKHNFTLVKEGYETMHVSERIHTPWYQWVPLDFISEVLVPFNIEEVHRFTYTMQPRKDVTPNDLLGRGQGLRDRAKTITPPPKHQEKPETAANPPPPPPGGLPVPSAQPPESAPPPRALPTTIPTSLPQGEPQALPSAPPS